MDAKLKEDLFRRYVTALEKRLEEGGDHTGPGSTQDGDRSRHKDSEALLSTATALLGAYQPDPGQRFRMVRFYEVMENSLRSHRGVNLRSLERAFHTLETICTNLLLFPWKKEFRCIKVSFVYWLGLLFLLRLVTSNINIIVQYCFLSFGSKEGTCIISFLTFNVKTRLSHLCVHQQSLCRYLI